MCFGSCHHGLSERNPRNSAQMGSVWRGNRYVCCVVYCLFVAACVEKIRLPGLCVKSVKSVKKMHAIRRGETAAASIIRFAGSLWTWSPVFVGFMRPVLHTAVANAFLYFRNSIKRLQTRIASHLQWTHSHTQWTVASLRNLSATGRRMRIIGAVIPLRWCR
jgi:hypothetical protein